MSFAFLDNLGRVRRAVSETVPKFWDSVSDGNFLYSIVATAQAAPNGTSKDMSIELQCLNGQLRWQSGIELGRVLQTEDFRGINRIVESLL